MITLQSLGYDQYFRRPLPQEYQLTSAVNYDSLFEDGSVISNKLEDGSIGSAKISSIRFDQIEGGTAILGGSNNKSGVLSVRDEANVEKVLIDKTGITMKDEDGQTFIDANGLISTSTFPSFNKIVLNIGGNLVQTISTDATYTTITDGTKPCTFNVTVTRETKIFIFGRADMDIYSASNHSTLGRLAIKVAGTTVDEAFFTADLLVSGGKGYQDGVYATPVSYVGIIPAGTTTISLQGRIDRLSGAANMEVFAYNFSYYLLGT